MNKIKNKITCGGIETQFYEKNYPILTQVLCQFTPSKPHKINHRQLAIIQKRYVLQSSHSFPMPKVLLLSSKLLQV
jgi:hypothetical protein